MKNFEIKYEVRIYSDAAHSTCVAMAVADDLMVALAFIGVSSYWEIRDGALREEESHGWVADAE